MSWDPVHDGRRAFRGALAAMCDPGAAAAGVPRAGMCVDAVLDRAAGLLLALLDPGLGLATAGDVEDLAATLRALTGAARASVAEADFVLVGAGATGPVAAAARRGTPLAPERGATLVYAGPWSPVPVRLSGPGLAGTRTVRLPLPASEIDGLIDANRRPPLGVDAFLAATDGIYALPRSLSLEPEAN